MRNRHLLLLDLVALSVIPFALIALRYETLNPPAAVVAAVTVYVLLAVPIRVSIYYATGAYSALWRYAGVVELQRLLFAAGVSGVITFIVGAFVIEGTGLAATRLPYSTLINDALFTLGAIAFPRLAMRMYARAERRTVAPARRVLIAGAGFAGQAILKELQTGGRLNLMPVGFVDDDLDKQRQQIGGVPVLGTIADIRALVAKLGVDEIIIAMPGAGGAVVRRVLQEAEVAGVPTRTVPGMFDLIAGRVSVSALRKVEIQDLLRREAVNTDLSAVQNVVAGRAVLVTGAGGSIGSELCRQISDLEPAALVLLDHSENQVFEIENEIRARHRNLEVVPLIADVRDAARLHALFKVLQPHAVFHAAAHKHVPLMEHNPVEAITNNIAGTRNTVDAALDAGSAHFVLVSTDKAVRPTSVMGASKRIAESIVLGAGLKERRHFVAVRFGNVLGSRGSVVPTFLRQIEDGGPVTVTHPEMRRFFMTIPEAVQLVLQAGTLGKGGELFILDMGDQVKIVDLARDLIRLSGLEEGRDIAIEYTGIRPGEKLYEEVLFGDEDVRPTEHAKIVRAITHEPHPAFISQVDALVRFAMLSPDDHAGIRKMLRGLVPDYALEDARTAPFRPSPAPGALNVRNRPA
ncbi:MAG: nucleoside-diphosphate sugar epimerase/dehydratase [Gemmatimonadota bacterium]|nr:nucleoside-diphosphate sugar epimerase/dehydratase [Gemmatimonadota bacterium]